MLATAGPVGIVHRESGLALLRTTRRVHSSLIGGRPRGSDPRRTRRTGTQDHAGARTSAAHLAAGVPMYRDALFDFLLEDTDCSRTALREAAAILSGTSDSDPAYYVMRIRLEETRKLNASADVRLGRLFLIIPQATYRLVKLICKTRSRAFRFVRNLHVQLTGRDVVERRGDAVEASPARGPSGASGLEPIPLFRRLLLVLAGEGCRHTDPNGRESQVECRKGRHDKPHGGSGVDYSGLKHVAESPEESVDRCFCFVLRVSAGGKEQGLPCRVLDRVVAAIIEDLQDAHQPE
jgi:hypothetical protein